MPFAQGALGFVPMLAVGTWFVVFIVLGVVVFAYAIYYLIFRIGKEP
ncbi:MAG TPA: hypothetical protein VFT80_06520 [Actinomycetota bacterium]|nr:hypothetical protein [Actinomycetota bacterium]